MKIQHILISSCLIFSTAAFAEPPKDKQAASAQKKNEKIELAVEKIERTDRKLKAPQDGDLDGDGYGDVAAAARTDSDYPKGAAKAAGDPIPDIDITVNQSPPSESASTTGVENATAGQAKAAEKRTDAQVKKAAKKKEKCTRDEDCDDYQPPS